MSRFRVLLAVGLGLLLVGAGAVVASATVDAPPAPELVTAPEPVNPGADDPMDISANNSPTLARNPTDHENVVLAHKVDLPRYACGLYVSDDGGASWEETTIPQPPDTEPKCYAPDVAFASDGTLYVVYVMLSGRGNSPGSVWVASSDDGGESLSEPRRVAGELSFQVGLAVDPGDPERLYLTWLDAENSALSAFPDAGYPIVMSRSDDGGETWDDPVQVSDPDRERVLAPRPAVGDDGTLYVLHLDLLDDRLDYHGGHKGLGGPPYQGPWELLLARSDDEGQTWSETTVSDDLTPTERFLVFLPPFPSIAVHGDRVHAAFHDGRLGDADAWLWTSEDQGASWNAPVRINDTPEADGTTQRLPTVAVAPDGRLDVVYYDRRRDDEDVMTEVSLQSSGDGGQTFGPRLALSAEPFDTRIGPGSERDMTDLGSRLALLSDEDQAMAAWTDTQRGTIDSAKQDIARAVASFDGTGAGGSSSLLRWGGIALGAGGLVTLGGLATGRPAFGGSRRRRPARSRKSGKSRSGKSRKGGRRGRRR